MAGPKFWEQDAIAQPAPQAPSAAQPALAPDLRLVVPPQPKSPPAQTEAQAAKDRLELIAKRRELGLDDDGNPLPVIESSLSGADYLKTLPEQDARMAKAIAEGRVDIPRGRQATNPQWQRWLNQAMQYDPELDQANVVTRRSTRRDFTSGPSAKNITAINTALGHLDTLAGAAEDLDNFGSLGPLTGVANRARYAYLQESGDPRTARFKQSRDAVANELMRVFRQVGASTSEIEEWQKNIDAAQSPDQLKASIQTAADLLGSRLSAMNDTYRRGMGMSSDVFELLSPHSREIFSRYGYGPGDPGGDNRNGAAPGAGPGGGPGTGTGPGGGGDIGFVNGAEVSRLPEGAVELQRAFQSAFVNGQIGADRQSVRQWLNAYNQANNTHFTVPDDQLGAAVEAMKKGVVPIVATPEFAPVDISDVRGEEQGNLSDQLNAGVRGAVDTVTFGTFDKLAAGADTIFKGGTMDENLARQYAISDFDEENHPIARIAGQMLVGLAIPLGYEGVARSAAIGAMREAAAAGAPIAEARQAAQVAAARAVRNRMARDGALIGGAYGAGSSRSLEDIPENAILGAATGSATGAVVGQAGVKLAGRTPSAGPAEASIEASHAADELGIDLPKFVVGDAAAQKKAAALEQTVPGAKPISDATRQMLEQSEAARTKIATDVGTPAKGEAMGDAARDAANRSAKAERKRIGAIYDRARIASNNQGFTASETNTILGKIATNEREALGGSKVGDIMSDLGADLQEKGGKLTIDGARNTRTQLRARLRDEAGLTPDNADRLTNLVMGAINKDIENGLIDAGKTRALGLYREADRDWAKLREFEEDILKPYIGKDGDAWGSDVAKRINSDVKGNGTRLARFISALPDDEANNVRASLVMRLGKATNSNQNAEGDAFSLDTFLTNWSEIEGARNLVFPKETVQSLDKLAKVAEVVKAAGRSKNRSNTGGVVSYLMSDLPAQLGAATAIYSHDPKMLAYGMIVSGLRAARQYGAAKLLSSPEFAKKLAATPLNAKGATSFWSRPWVRAMMVKNPTLAPEIERFQRAFLQSANDNALTSAAASPDSDEND